MTLTRWNENCWKSIFHFANENVHFQCSTMSVWKSFRSDFVWIEMSKCQFPNEIKMKKIETELNKWRHNGLTRSIFEISSSFKNVRGPSQCDYILSLRHLSIIQLDSFEEKVLTRCLLSTDIYCIFHFILRSHVRNELGFESITLSNRWLYSRYNECFDFRIIRFFITFHCVVGWEHATNVLEESLWKKILFRIRLND